jgi:hypothetical protein
MEIDTTINISILISACLAIIGWMVNNYFKRKHEIAKKRLEYRLETLHSFIPVAQSLKSIANTSKIEPEFYDKINNSHLKFQLYGDKIENDIFFRMIACMKSNNISCFNELAQELMNKVLDEIRYELEFPKIK